MKKLTTVFSNYANKGNTLKKLFLFFAATTYTIANCTPLTFSKDVPLAFSLPLADCNAGDASVIFVLNNAPSEGISNTGGWNYIITRAPKLTTAETIGTSLITVTNVGVAGDSYSVSFTNTAIVAGGQTQTLFLGTGVSTGVSVTADAAAIAAAINANTAKTGFSATSAVGVVTLKNPNGAGALLNTMTLTPTVTLVAGGTLAVTTAALGSTTAGVTAVYTSAEVIYSKMPNPLKPGDFINANVSTAGGLNDAILAYQNYTYHAY